MTDFPAEFEEPSELPALGSETSELNEKEHASDPNPSIPCDGSSSNLGNSVYQSDKVWLKEERMSEFTSYPLRRNQFNQL